MAATKRKPAPRRRSTPKKAATRRRKAPKRKLTIAERAKKHKVSTSVFKNYLVARRRLGREMLG